MTMTDSLEYADVLILGAGFAGLRAAVAAKQSHPRGRVLCCGLGYGPSGSSFANPNNRLGMQVFATPDERDVFRERTLEIAPPGKVSTELVDILVNQSMERFQDLIRMDVPFASGESTHSHDIDAILQSRLPGCFLQEQSSAVFLQDLHLAQECLIRQFLDTGGEILPSVQVLDLCRSPGSGAVNGAVLRLRGENEPSVQPAGAVVLALGGGASLYRHNLAGSWSTGISPALLQRAGARLENAGLLQFMWYIIEPRRFLPLDKVITREWGIRTDQGDLNPGSLPGGLSGLAPLRSRHCPYGHGLEDAAIDLWLPSSWTIRARSVSAPQGKRNGSTPRSWPTPPTGAHGSTPRAGPAFKASTPAANAPQACTARTASAAA